MVFVTILNFLMCVTWCLVVLSGRGAVGRQLRALGRVIVQGEPEPNPDSAWLFFVLVFFLVCAFVCVCLCVCVFVPTGCLSCRPLCLVFPLIAQQRHRADSTLILG